MRSRSPSAAKALTAFAGKSNHALSMSWSAVSQQESANNRLPKLRPRQKHCSRNNHRCMEAHWVPRCPTNTEGKVVLGPSSKPVRNVRVHLQNKRLRPSTRPRYRRPSLLGRARFHHQPQSKREGCPCRQICRRLVIDLAQDDPRPATTVHQAAAAQSCIAYRLAPKWGQVPSQSALNDGFYGRRDRTVDLTGRRCKEMADQNSIVAVLGLVQLSSVRKYSLLRGR
jgi:hypothetical protein